MKIAFITQPFDGVLPPHQNSIGILTHQIARRLAQSDDIIVYARWMRSQPRVKYDQNIHYRFVPAVPNRIWLKLTDLFSHLLNPKRPFFATSLYYLEYILHVARDLRKQQPDIIHIHNFSQFVPIIRAFNPNVKIVLHMHCEWLSQLDPAMVERRLNKTDLVIGCSEYITEKVRHRFPQFADRCQTLLNGVDANHFVSKSDYNATPINEIKRVLFVGRVSPEKGVHILLDAFQEVFKYYPQVRLDIVGPVGVLPIEFLVALSGDEQVSHLNAFYNHKVKRGIDYLSCLKTRLSLDSESLVSFHGFVPHSRLLKYYRGADVFVFPSVWNEPFGMPVVEAMVNEVPVVATRSGGITEIIEEGKTGLLVERGDVTALTKAILHLFADEQLRRSMGQAGRQRVLKHFSWDLIAENLLNYYTSIR